MDKTYTAYLIEDEARAALLETFAPKYPKTVAHHITHHYGGGAGDMPEKPQKAEVVGYHDSGAIQVLVVEIDGRKHQQQSKGEPPRFLHITLSYDPAQGASPGKSNDVLEKIVAEKGEAGLRNLKEPIEISVTPALLIDRARRPAPKAPPPAAPGLR
jgi:hypothetical protein